MTVVDHAIRGREGVKEGMGEFGWGRGWVGEVGWWGRGMGWWGQSTMH